MIAIYASAIILGGLVGFWSERAAVFLIDKRVTQPFVHRFSGNTTKTTLWILLNSIGWLAAVLIGGLTTKTVAFVLIYSICLIMSAVDISIRKIPNETLLFILIVQILSIITNNQPSNINVNLIGFAVGFVIFLLPSYIGKGAGLGDVKFAAVAGFCLGLYDFLTAIIIMTVVLLIYTLYILITRKGGLKTKIALAPFMASGFLTVMLINIMNDKHMIFKLETLMDSFFK